MANKGSQEFLRATKSGLRPGVFPLGSAQSRAAARSLLAARKASEEDETRFQCCSIMDGKPVNFDGLAETIRLARMRDHTGELPALNSEEDGCEDHSEGIWGERLRERMRMARERVASAQGLEARVIK
jgi:hypothetical protein